MNDTQANRQNRKRTTLKLVLAGVAIVGVGAAVTTAVWTDNVFFSATATSSSFDLQGRAGTAGAWLDVGIPGDSDVTPIALTSAELDALSPEEVVTVPFQLCNIGNTAGTVTAITPPTFSAGDELLGAAGLTLTVTGVTAGSTALPSDPGCLTPINGNLVVTTTDLFVLQGASGTITFDVTGTSD
jgi:hypothetical protein